jgi:hypothetical protein
LGRALGRRRQGRRDSTPPGEAFQAPLLIQRLPRSRASTAVPMFPKAAASRERRGTEGLGGAGDGTRYTLKRNVSGPDLTCDGAPIMGLAARHSVVGVRCSPTGVCGSPADCLRTGRPCRGAEIHGMPAGPSTRLHR